MVLCISYTAVESIRGELVPEDRRAAVLGWGQPLPEGLPQRGPLGMCGHHRGSTSYLVPLELKEPILKLP